MATILLTLASPRVRSVLLVVVSAIGVGAGVLFLRNTEQAATAPIILHGHTHPIRAIAIDPDGKRLATAGGGLPEPWCELKLWDLATGKERYNLTGHTSRIESAAFSPDGQILATSGYDHSVRLWDSTTGKERTILHGHTEYVRFLAFSPDGKSLASVSRLQRLYSLKHLRSVFGSIPYPG